MNWSARGMIISLGMALASGEALDAVEAVGLPPVTERDALSWKQIKTGQITPDGQWFAYLIGPIGGRPGEGLVVLRSMRDETERRYVAGDVSLGAGNLKMSPSGRWIAFREVARQPDNVVVIEIATGARRDFEGALDFEFIAAKDELIVLQGAPASQTDDSFELTITALDADDGKTFPGVTKFAVNSARTRVAWASQRDVRIYDAALRETHVVDLMRDGAYRNLTWSNRGDALAMLRGGNTGPVLVVLTRMGKSRPKKTVLSPEAWPDFPSRYRFTSSLQWREDETGIFVEIQAPPPAAHPPTVSNLALWHWRDERLPGQKKASAGRAPTQWCFISLTSNRFVRLTTPELPDPGLQSRGRYLLDFDRPYGWNNPDTGLDTSQRRDYYLVDTHTGQRKLLVQGLKVVTRPGLGIPPQFSPNGSIVLFQDNNGDYIAHDIEKGTQRNLTNTLPTKFYFEENDPRNGRQFKDSEGQGSPLVQGWTGDGKYVLVSDFYDVWALPLKNGRPLNLTTDGRRRETWHTLADFSCLPVTLVSRWRRQDIDLDAPIYFYGFDLSTGKRGLLKRTPGQGELESLHWDYADISYHRAGSADAYIYSRVTAVDSRDYYRVGARWQPEERLTDVNSQQRKFQWAPEPRYLTYKNVRGDTRHARLHLPYGYVSGRSYPTIVEIYRQMSPAIHSYRPPYPHDSNPELLPLHKGYAVLKPDIVPRLNESGQAAVQDVTAAVEAALATGAVNPEQLGLQGISFGAYETLYVVSHTGLFKAAVAWGGPTNLWSNCGGVYLEAKSKSSYCEHSQPFLAGPWWEQWDAYLQNSPLYHAQNLNTPLLLVHGSEDTAVPISQSLELFNALRRMGGKPVVLLEYKGEGHVRFSETTKRDLEWRMTGFFDHFLKGAPVPAWWSDGVSYYEGQAPAVDSPLTAR